MYKKTVDSFRKLDDETWYNMLVKSIEYHQVDGLEMPRFPTKQIQNQFVGSNSKHALFEAANFYKLAKNYALTNGQKIEPGIKAMDFGCGWGRLLRFLWKDVLETDLYGVDVDPFIINICKETQVPGKLYTIKSRGSLDNSASSINLILAYSVFTHLPEDIFIHWMSELSRVASSGCIFVFTVEPRKFLEFIKSLKGKNHESGWHSGLANFADNVPQLLNDYDQGRFIYLPTGGGGEFRTKNVYGDAIIPITFIESALKKLDMKVCKYISNNPMFMQDIIVAKKI
jgi:2-polyprenyl-3-methyl-5-hydroxy-6-metoxy-1,4-benzoquinol methylase